MQVKKFNICNEEVIAGSGEFISGAFNAWNNDTFGVMALQIKLTGTGTAKVQVLESVDGVDYVVPSNLDDIVTAFTVTSGTSGIDILPIPVYIANYIKIKITETAGSEITVTSSMAFQ